MVPRCSTSMEPFLQSLYVQFPSARAAASREVPVALETPSVEREDRRQDDLPLKNPAAEYHGDLDSSVTTKTPAVVRSALQEVYGDLDASEWADLGPAGNESHAAAISGTSLVYGEIHPDGVTRLFGADGLNLPDRDAKCLFELGCGRGRVALQAFLQFSSLRTVVAVELVASRYSRAVEAARRLCCMYPERYTLEEGDVHASMRLRDGPRVCEFQCGDLLAFLAARGLGDADAIVLNLVVPSDEVFAQLASALLGSKPGCVVVSLENLRRKWPLADVHGASCPLEPVDLGGGGVRTTWNVSGAKFYCYCTMKV
eukprot:TRINITY_DN75163_c0_g1_i1.p1 TRINITY_DN75163_c0_g1~~TRINITY_DN75163_c0_g1_i1.p1  ORF type:complete len:314 (-),score=40.55 TRINITY_DN75163_c0_g1_i1:17-958(-)